MNNKKIQRHRFLDDLREAARWFAPGLGVKRWFLFIMAGITLLGIGFAMFLLDLYRTDSTNETLLAILSYASLRFLPRVLRILIFGGIGLWLVGYGIVRLNRSLLRPYLRSGRILLDDLTKFRNTFLARSRSISLLFSEDCAKSDINAPSSSRTLLLIL